ncbi:MAG: aminomethyl-transferring glycine dehydrogenase [Elusimicrobiota bacterium]
MPTRKHSVDPKLSLNHPDRFVRRHIGPSTDEVEAMLKELGYGSLDALIDAVIPAPIRSDKPLRLAPPFGEGEALEELRKIAADNQVFRSFIGMGYHNTIMPAVIRRNVLENPGWYTQYTPYQAEIAQGRLEALLNFQHMVMDLTGMEVANASMLDEATAAAEAMTMSFNLKGSATRQKFFVSNGCHPQTLDVVRTRAWPLGIEVVVGDHATFTFDDQVFGALLQYPATDGTIYDYEAFCARAKDAGALVAVAADILALTMLRPPGEFGADIAVGSTQRFGVPLGYGGPHAAYFATRDAHKRSTPGRIVGVSKDDRGKPALRLALQTREQHIRRERATSNICTAQVLLAVLASMYAVYHGPDGLRAIAERVHRLTVILALGLTRLGHKIVDGPFFDTIKIPLERDLRDAIIARAVKRRINLRVYADGLGVALDEKTSAQDAADLFAVFSEGGKTELTPEALAGEIDESFPDDLARTSPYLQHRIFQRNRSETEMMRYLHRLETKDLSLNYSMIPLGSCTMKLNATSEMLPITWRKLGELHPFAPADQAQGYRRLFTSLESALAEITGFAAVSLQPNAGSQGEYAGLLVIRKYHEDRGEEHRDVCLIPLSAHGTNPASAKMAGMRIVGVRCDQNGNIDLEDLKMKAKENAKDLAALMITYPSTHGVFETTIKDICAVIHEHGGQIYLDGANLNAQVGLCRPGDYGADVCHLNLHKTFAIPHGGGGPGMGPIGVMPHLAPYLPSHCVVATGGDKSVGAIAAAPWGSPSILPITWMYIRMMGAEGLTEASKIAILNANYVAKRLSAHYPVLYKGGNGLVAHECIIDLRGLKAAADVTVDDVAKRLMDHGYHAPTVSWPVMGTMMIEPTESESKEELDIFITAMTAIREEVRAIERGELDKIDNPLKNAPHTAEQVVGNEWRHPYSREQAAYPSPWTREFKFWPPVGRIDAPYGDRNLVCSCPPAEAEDS